MWSSAFSIPSPTILKMHYSPRYYLTQPVKLFKNNFGNYFLHDISSFMSLRAPFAPRTTNMKFNSTKKLKPRPILTHCHVVDMLASNVDEYPLSGLERDNMPKHVAIILDGNRRWLKAHGKPLTYVPCFEANMLFADLCIEVGVGTASCFIYSLRNMQRNEEANNLIFEELQCFLKHNTRQFNRKGIRVVVIGERELLPQTLQNTIRQLEDATKHCTKLELMLAVCYSGTCDIANATKSICEKVKNGTIEPREVDEALIENELSTGGARSPQIDLVIRTGGRLRVSDYLMWQLAQAELYFTNVCAPEFSEVHFVEALRSFQQRERTFGK